MTFTRSEARRWLPVLLLCVAVGLAYTGLHWMLDAKTDPADEPPLKSVEIAKGTSLHQVAATLEREGVIRSRLAFVVLAKLTFADRRIRPGDYAFHAGMRPMEILSDLEEGRVTLHQVTFPEGFTVAQIAERVAAHGLADRDEFLQASRDAAFMRTLDVAAPSLEGYLFPTTYRFAKNSPPRDMIRTMVAFTWRTFTPKLRARAADLNMTIHQVLTLASVIEKETGAAAERMLISSVFHNRLRRKIPLQSDPTVIYALEAFDGNLRKRDLSVDSPYNTYRVRGLPPGPIANPGAEAIVAALYPAKAYYLYFVSRNDGTHHFSSTLAEHNRAVDKYQRRRYRRVS